MLLFSRALGLFSRLLVTGLLLLTITATAIPSYANEPTSTKDFTNLKTKTTVYPPWFKHTFWDLGDDVKEALAAGKTGIMIYTSTKTCSYCIAFIERSLNNPAIQARLRKRFDVLGLEVINDGEITDVDGKAYPVKDFLAKYRAYFTPSLIFFGKDGLMLVIRGYYPPEKFNQVLDYLEAGAYKNEPWRAWYARHRKPEGQEGIVHDTKLFPLSANQLDRSHTKGKRPLAVLFEQSGCADCKELHEQTLADAGIRKLLRQFDAVQVDARDNRTLLVTPGGRRTTPAQWATALDLATYPAFVFFDEAGKEVFRIDTYTRKSRLGGTLELVLTRGYLDEPQLQRWRRKQFVRRQSQ